MVPKRGRVVLVVFCLLLIGPAVAREWTDDSGRFKVEADLVRVEGDAVVLRKADGNTVTVSLAKLGAADRRFPAIAAGEAGPTETVQRCPETSPRATPRYGPAVDQGRKGTRRRGPARPQRTRPVVMRETLTACAGDPSLCLKDDFSAMNAYMIAAEVKLRLGESEAGKDFVARSLAAADKLEFSDEFSVHQGRLPQIPATILREWVR